MASKEKRGAWGRAATPPFANTFITVSETVHIMGSVFAGAKILEVSLNGVKKKRGVGGGGGAAPFANTFITGSEGVHMCFVYVARMIAAAILHSLKLTRECWRERNPSFANKQPV